MRLTATATFRQPNDSNRNATSTESHPKRNGNASNTNVCAEQMSQLKETETTPAVISQRPGNQQRLHSRRVTLTAMATLVICSAPGSAGQNVPVLMQNGDQNERFVSQTYRHPRDSCSALQCRRQRKKKENGQATHNTRTLSSAMKARRRHAD